MRSLLKGRTEVEPASGSRKPGLSATDFFAIITAVVVCSIVLVLSIAWWARQSLEPYLQLKEGFTTEQVEAAVGRAEYRTPDLALVRDRSETPSFACSALSDSLPGLLNPIFSETSKFYGPEQDAPLPEPQGDLLVYFPFLYEVLVYLDVDGRVVMVLVCTT